ncbi:MAG: 16S rRNA (uracil(1498)-N(3))-methyltransferase [Planctomycetaceae bacterium]
MHRFYIADSLNPDVVDLTGDEAAHLARVLRLTVGEQVCAFDGKGNSAVAEIMEAGKRSARLRILERLPVFNLAGPDVTLITAVPKSDRFRWLVEKATELGVRRLIPVRTERSVVHPGDGKLQKMQAAVIAACKQCGRNDLLTIEPAQEWADVMQLATGRQLLVADPQGRPIRDISLRTESGSELALAIGPEGGLAPREVDVARQAGAVLVCLGPSILRIETAALAMAAWVRFAAST